MGDDTEARNVKFQENIAVLLEIALEQECSYTAEFLSMASESFIAESKVYSQRVKQGRRQLRGSKKLLD